MRGHDVWAEVLALRAAVGSATHPLAAQLCAAPDAFLKHPDLPTPTLIHRRLAERQVEALLRLGLEMVPVWALPCHLRRVRPLPVALFVRGDLELIHHRPATAIVGTRKASSNGVRWARALAQTLARKGALVISGGAFGIDTAAHEGALAAGGRTLVYMGTAIDRVYPRSNEGLFQRILQHRGALVSEHPPFANTFKGHHAQRNRFIAAHGERLVVVEAALASGTLSAVHFARRLGTHIDIAPKEVGGERGAFADLLKKGWVRVWQAPSGP